MIKKLEAVAAIREFNRFYTNIIGVVNRKILESPYSLSEVRVLYEIRNTPLCTARKIKNTIQIDEGYLSRIIEKFVNGKLVKKVQSGDDGRLFVLSLTPKGNKLFNRLNESSDSSIEALVNKLTDHEMQEVITMLDGIRRILSKQ
jgi:DNA-binding MarR family transcriptional regulator